MMTRKSLFKIPVLCFGLAMLISCSYKATTSSDDDLWIRWGNKELNTDDISLELKFSPYRVLMSEREDFKISVIAKNTSKDTINPHLGSSILYVNGKSSFNWELNIGNGRRSWNWTALPPGEKLVYSRSHGESFFPGPGFYTLVLRLQDKYLAPIIVQVTEKKIPKIKGGSSRADSIQKEFYPKSWPKRWTTTKKMPTKVVVTTQIGEEIWSTYFIDGKFELNHSQFEPGKYWITISDTLGPIMAEEFMVK